MAECPWCHAQVQYARVDGPCPRCGKQARDLRTTDPPDATEAPAEAMAPPRPSPLAAPPVLEVPDLVVPKPAPSRPSPAGVPPKAPTAPSSGDFDLQLDLGAVGLQPPPARPPPPPAHAPLSADAPDPFEDDLSAGPALELDTSGGSLPAPLSQRPLAQEPAPPAVSAHPQPVEARPSTAPKPVDPFEARALADYGPPPNAVWLAPLYAYRVLSRRRDLQRLLAQKRVEAEACARRAEDGWVAFGERARELLERNGGRGLDQVVAAEQVLRGRDGALAGAMDAYKAELAVVDERLGGAEGDLARVSQDQERLVALCEAADEDRKRADAKVKRLDIEVRNAGALEPGARAAERTSLAAELAAMEAKLAEASGKVALAQQVTRAAQAKVDALRAERTAVEGRFARQAGTRGDGVEEARRQLRAALVALGRAMLADASTADLGTARAEIARLDERAQSAAKQLVLHEAATSAYDVGKVALGVGVVVAAFVLLLVLLLFPFIYGAIAS